MESRSRKISRTASIEIATTREAAFPLFGPLREREWAHGWEPRVVSEEEGTLEHMVFSTEGHSPHETQYTWVVSQYRPDDYFLEYTVSTQERVWFITIACSAIAEKRTRAEISYTYVALSELGARLNEMASAYIFRDELKDWEAAISYYLKTGKRLTHH